MIPANELLNICCRSAGSDQTAIDARITAVSAFKSDIKRKAVDLADVPVYFEALTDAYDFKNSQLHSLAFSAICYLTRRVLILDESALQSQVPIVLPMFIDNFAGDSGHENQSKLAIRTFEDVWLAFAPETEQALRENGLSHSSPQVRAASLKLLSQYIAKSAKFSFRKFTPSVTRMLNDADPNVQQAARDLIVQFFSTAIPRAKEDLKKEMSKQKTPQNVFNDIFAAIGLDSRPASRQATLNPAPRSTVSTKTTSTIETVKALPDFSLEDLEPIDVVSVDSFRKEIERMAECFVGKESETNWRQRETSVVKLRKLIRGNITEYPGDVVWAIKTLQDGIVKSICSLRTTLTAQGCFLIKDAMQIYQSYMDPAIEPFLTNLVKVSAGSKKIAVGYAHVTICAMILSTSYSFKYITQISQVMNDKVAAARALAMVWLDLLFSRHNAHLVAVWQSQGVDVTAEACIERGLTDSAPAVRTASRSAYWSFAQNFSDVSQKLMNKLDSVQKKMLIQAPRVETPPEPARRSISVTLPEQAPDAQVQARRSVSERVSERISERVSEQVSERLDKSRESLGLDSDVAKLSIQQELTPDPSGQGHDEVVVAPDLVEPVELVKQGAELLKARIEEDPEAKETVEQVSKLVEATVREAKAKKAKSPGASTADGEEPVAGKENEANDSTEDATGAIDEAVEEVKEKLDCDPEKLKNKLSTLSEMLSSEDLGTLNKGVGCLSYVLRGKSVPEELAKDLVNVDLPDPDLIGRALQLIFDKVGDEMDDVAPEIKETIAKFVSPDLVAVSLEYIGHAAVVWAAVNFLPAEMVMVVFEVIKPLLDIGTLVEAIFDVVTADSPTESITLVCGQMLLRLDKVPLTDALRGQVQQVLSLVYRFGDLAEDVSAFIGSWLGDSDDSSDDEETLAQKQSHKDEKAALANTSGSLLSSKPETPDISVYSDPVIMSHHVSVSYVPASDLNTSKPKLNLHKIASPRRRTNNRWEIGPAQSLPESDEECSKLLERLVGQIDNGSIGKSEFVELALLLSEKQDLPNFRTETEKLERSILTYLQDDKRSENELAAGLLLVRKMLERGQYSTAVERTLVLQCLNVVCEREVTAKLHYGAVPDTRDRLFELADLDTHGTILTLVDLYTNGSTRHSKVFALQSLRRIVPQAEQVPPPLGEVVHAALSDEDVYIRKEAYPILLRIHQKSETTAELLKARMSSGQRRLYEFYAGKA